MSDSFRAIQPTTSRFGWLWQAERVGPRGGVTVVFCARQDGQTEPPENAIWCQTQERAAKPRWPAR